MLSIKWRTADYAERNKKETAEAARSSAVSAVIRSGFHSTIAARMKAVIAGVLSFSMMAAGTGCSLLPKEEVQEKLPEIRTPQISQKPEFDVTRGTLESKVSGSGKLMSEREENLVFTLDNRRIAEVYVKAGDRVKAGQVLAELETGDTDKQIRRKEIELETVELDLKMALRNAGTDETETDSVALRKKQLEYELLKEDLADLRDSLQASKLVAPFDGTIISFTAEKGDLAKAYEKVGQIADTQALVVAVKFASGDLSAIAPGMDAVVSINTFGDYAGTVRRLPVDASARDDSLDSRVLIDLDDMPDGAMHGTPLSASVIIERRTDVLTIPVAALRKQNSRYYVIVSHEGGARGETDVEIGLQTATDVEIVSGLQEGQKVVGK